ncbi:MAG: capsular polysaccharide biosynthesis protein CapF [Rikenellaceae bacterium]
MNILVTGSKGFIGRNLVAQLRSIQSCKASCDSLLRDITIFEYDIDSGAEELDSYCRDADFVFNLAGVNRPKELSEFMEGNCGFTRTLLDTLKRYSNSAPVVMASSSQAVLDNAYGESKLAAEQLMFEYSKQRSVKVLVYRFTNVFGKWCRPNYNSVVATFCSNITNGLEITVDDQSKVMALTHIDDLVDEMIAALKGQEHREGDYCVVPTVYSVTLGRIAELLHSFKAGMSNLSLPNVGDGFEKRLYSTYTSYLPADGFSYPLAMNVDDRGSFTEIIRTEDRGQFSVNISKPHVTKGQHWHHTKSEKFVVVSGTGVIRFRDMRHEDAEVIEYFVSGDSIEVVNIPTGYVHNIENLGDCDMVTFMWCSECYDPQRPDTFFDLVSKVLDC